MGRMLQKEVIRVFASPLSSFVVLATKKGDSTPFCVDYRRQNETPRKDVYPMTRIYGALKYFYVAMYFSSFNLLPEYRQISMAKTDKAKTAFATPDGLHELTIIPFDVFHASATSERVKDAVVSRLRCKICLCCLDYIAI